MYKEGENRVAFVVITTVLILLLFIPLATPCIGGDMDLWQGLMEQLSRDGFNRAFIQRIYSDNRVRFEPQVMPRKLLHREKRLDYEKFLGRKRIEGARRFLQAHSKLIEEIEQKYGVPGPIKTAILLVETDLGNYTGNYLIINILSSMSISSDLNRVSKWLPKNVLKDPSLLEKFEKKAKKKAAWAYVELKAFLKFTAENKIDPLKVRGSPFGAFGLCQFMPSSAMRYGVDYNGDGRIDLFSIEDALASMANYLRKNGWHRGITQKQAYKVLLKYNYSRPYAETILKVADILEDSEDGKRGPEKNYQRS